MTFPLSRPARLAVFASGRGSNLSALLSAFPPGDPLAALTLLISNKAQVGALELAAAAGIPAYTYPFPSRKRDPEGQARAAFEAEAERRLQEAGIDLICLAGFMRIFSPAFNARWHGRILNVHPSLLPAFPGLHPQRQALEAGVPESGCTVHFVDAGVDTGEVIVQRRVPVQPTDTEETLGARILREEHIAYPEAVRRVLHGQARPDFEAEPVAATEVFR
jgi:phosphoribosylglycinamide formyltransferase-1